MENRFGFKDLVVILLLLAIAVMLGLKMVQDDRQWERLSALHTKLDQQTTDLVSLRRVITDGGLRVRSGGDGVPPQGEPQEDIFRRVRNVKEREDYATGDWIVESFASAPPKLNYFTSHDVYSRVIQSKVLEPLAMWDLGKVEMVPYIAEHWKMSDDGLTLDVTLRRNVTFSDGQPLTADDVVYTWSIVQNPEITDGAMYNYYRPIKSCEKTGDYQVRFTFDKVHYENFMRAMEVEIVPKHFMSKYSDRDIRESPGLLMGSGPYRLENPTQYTPGQQIELVRNERYWGPPASFDRIIYRIIENESAELVAFRNGELDITVATPEQHLQMVKDKELVDTTQHLVYESVRSGYAWIAWNQKRGDKPTVFADKRVRQAMTLMIDRQRLLDELFHGMGRVASGPFHPMGKQDNPSIEPWPYDPQRAVALLEQAGFEKRGNVMYTPQGTPFEIEFTYPSGSELIDKMVLFLKDNLARAGVILKLNPQKWALFSETLDQRNFEAITLRWGGGNVEADIEQMFHTRSIAGSGDNVMQYRNPELDALIDKAHVTLNEEQRMEIWQKCHAILHEDQPYTFLTFNSIPLWLDDRIKNVQQIEGLGLNYVSTWPVPIEWYVPKELQKRGK